LKDNAVDTQLGFTVILKDGKSIMHSNQHMVQLSKADGSRMTTTFSRDELKEARSIVNNHLGVGRFVSTGTSATLTPANRIQHALYFTSAARANSDIGLKVSFYCSAIEALFASNPSELTHQLSERVASFLEDDPRKRSVLYGDVKRAYSVRSIVVHGKRAKASRCDQFVEAAEALDKMLRQVYFKIFTEPVAMTLIKLDDEEFNTHFLLRIFGASWKDLVDND
ncbi:MAG: HEPN domain-containing protein, partial [Deltaproteobacteria bacterium]|nr:HEPN domain-containing protein [Deltaproteobacteria bacterium]